MEVPPSIEGQQIASIFFTLPSHSSNPSLLKEDPSLLPLPGCWLAPCNADLHDPGHHTNEGACREAQGAFPDDRITDRVHKDRERMPALRLLPEYGGRNGVSPQIWLSSLPSRWKGEAGSSINCKSRETRLCKPHYFSGREGYYCKSYCCMVCVPPCCWLGRQEQELL